MIQQRPLARQRSKIQRKPTGRIEKGTALVVCEGKQTEPFYLRGLLHWLSLTEAHMEIIEGTSKSNAVSVVQRAQRRFEQAPRDRVFVLMDAEQDDLPHALKLCKTPLQRESQKKGLARICIEPVVSNPCFEFWLLLHFRYSDQPFARFADILPELRGDLPDYQKADPKIFLRAGGSVGLHRALSHVAKLRKELAKMGTESPSTDMDKLVEALRALAQ